MIVHVVSFKLSDPERDADALVAALRGLPAKIAEIRRFEVGRDVVRSARSYDVALVSEFDSLDDLRAYQQHPDHVATLSFIDEVTAARVAVDYER